MRAFLSRKFKSLDAIAVAHIAANYIHILRGTQNTELIYDSKRLQMKDLPQLCGYVSDRSHSKWYEILEGKRLNE